MRGIVCTVAVLVGFNVSASDTLERVMARLSSHDTVQIRYREVRHLALLTESWNGTGFLYTKPPGHLVKLQLQPTRELMAVSDGYLWYFNTKNNIRHHIEVDDGNAASLEISSFSALVNGDLSGLEAHYGLLFESDDSVWAIRLTARQDNTVADLAEISVSGPVDGPIEHVTIKKPDGDYNEFRLGEVEQGQIVANTIASLLAEVRGE